MSPHDDVDNNRRNIAEFRAGGGKVASFGAAPLLLLTTTGGRGPTT